MKNDGHKPPHIVLTLIVMTALTVKMAYAEQVSPS